MPVKKKGNRNKYTEDKVNLDPDQVKTVREREKFLMMDHNGDMQAPDVCFAKVVKVQGFEGVLCLSNFGENVRARLPPRGGRKRVRKVLAGDYLLLEYPVIVKSKKSGDMFWYDIQRRYTNQKNVSVIKSLFRDQEMDSAGGFDFVDPDVEIDDI